MKILSVHIILLHLIGASAHGIGDTFNELYNVVAESIDGLRGPEKNTEEIRLLLNRFVDSLDDFGKSRAYYPDASTQDETYNVCTIVQQCLCPDFMYEMGLMSSVSRSLVFQVLSTAMSENSFSLWVLQQQSNWILNEIQDWGTLCEGECRELYNPDGLLESFHEALLVDQSYLVEDTDYEACGVLRDSRNVFWSCLDEPKVVHITTYDTNPFKYRLGNIWNEPTAHSRTNFFDYFSVYGDLTPNGGAFGFRWSGHHLDINYKWNDEGELYDDLPVFLGHNPLIVPGQHPPIIHNKLGRPPNKYQYAQWTNLAGTTQFEESVDLIVAVANELEDNFQEAYVPLENWKSVSAFGALQLPDDKTMEDYSYVDLSAISNEEFEAIWSPIEYTLKLSRGDRPTRIERDIFRNQGKLLWTTSVFPRGLPLTSEDIRTETNFLNIHVETDDLFYFVMVNEMFAVVTETDPANHVHSLIIPKRYLNADHSCLDPSTRLCDVNNQTTIEDGGTCPRFDFGAALNP